MVPIPEKELLPLSIGEFGPTIHIGCSPPCNVYPILFCKGEGCDEMVYATYIFTTLSVRPEPPPNASRWLASLRLIDVWIALL